MEEKYYYIDFSGYCKIKATSAEEAKKFFWRRIDSTENTVVEIDCVEEAKEDSSDWEPDVDETGFNPYLGDYDFDC